MTTTIWKFPLLTVDQQTIPARKGAKPLAVQVQHGQLCLWALVDPNAEPAEMRVWVHGTGHIVTAEAPKHYLGTVQFMGGQLVFHVFTEAEPVR
jgi:hypothetical protein